MSEADVHSMKLEAMQKRDGLLVTQGFFWVGLLG